MHQLPMFWEVKQEVFICFPSTEKGNKKPKCISSWEINWNLYKCLESILLKIFSSYFSYVRTLEHHQNCHCQAKKRIFLCLHLFLHLLRKLNFLLKHVTRKLSCCSNTSSTGKFKSYCSWKRGEPGSSKSIACHFARRYLSAALSNFFKYRVLAMP